MAIIRYDRGLGRRVTPSQTNVVRTQGGTSGGGIAPSAGNFRAVDQYLSGVKGAPAPSTLTQAPARITLSDTGGAGGGTAPIDINQIVSDALSGLDFGVSFPTVVSGGTSGSSSASGQAALQNAALNALKYQAEQAQTAAAATAAQEAAARARLGTGQQAEAIRALLGVATGPGSYREGADRLLGLLSGYETTARQGITDARTAAERLLGEQYGRASGLLFGAPAQGETPAIQGAFPALTAYLQANAPTAFAQTPTGAAPTVQNALAQYMAGQGVGTGGVEQEVSAENAALQAAQGNYGGLLDILRRQETASQASRLAEAQQAGTVARTGLEAQRAAQGGAITRQEQSALQELAGALLGQRMGIETGAEQRKQTLQDALTSLLGTGYNVTGEQIAEETKKAEVPTTAPSDRAVNRNPQTDWQKLVAQKHPNFGGTWNEAKKKFPKLYKQYLDSKKKG